MFVKCYYSIIPYYSIVFNQLLPHCFPMYFPQCPYQHVLESVPSFPCEDDIRCAAWRYVFVCVWVLDSTAFEQRSTVLVLMALAAESTTSFTLNETKTGGLAFLIFESNDCLLADGFSVLSACLLKSSFQSVLQPFASVSFDITDSPSKSSDANGPGDMQRRHPVSFRFLDWCPQIWEIPSGGSLPPHDSKRHRGVAMK